MYSKTRLGADQIEGGLSLTPRGKRIACLIIAALVAAAVAIGVWLAVSRDDYATSANGCVSVTVPSTTGGGTLRYCGTPAVAFCRKAFTQSDTLSLTARPQCDLAGLTKAKVAAAVTSR